MLVSSFKISIDLAINKLFFFINSCFITDFKNCLSTKLIISNHSSETMEVVIEVFSGSLDWASEEILSLLMEVPSDSLIPRLIRNSPSIEVDSIRAKLLLGKCNDIRKMRYLEDLIGRNFGSETLSSVIKISEEMNEGPVRSMAIEVLNDRNTLGKGEVSDE